jgi:hypothetical protein
MDDKEKSVIDKLVEGVSNAVGEIAKAAVMPTRNEDAEAVAAKTNEQLYLGDAAVAPEAAMAQIGPKKRNTAPKRINKRVAKSAKTSGKSPVAKAPAKKAAAKKTTTKKSAAKTSPKESAWKNTGKTVAKKKKAKKSKRGR